MTTKQYEAVCDLCEKEFEYTLEMIEEYYDAACGNIAYVNCPHCGGTHQVY